MASKRLQVTFTSADQRIDKILTVEEAIRLIHQHVPDPKEATDALTFLDMDSHAVGSYNGKGWTFTFQTPSEL